MASVARRVLALTSVLILAGCSASSSSSPSASPIETIALPSSGPTATYPAPSPTEVPSGASGQAKCPTESPISVAAFVKAWEAEFENNKISCFGDRDVTILGWAEPPPAIGFTPDAYIQPSWLWYQPLALWDRWCAGGGHCPSVMVHIDPDSGMKLRDDGRWVLVTGHTRDPQAESCRYVYLDTWKGSPLPDSDARDVCRSSFVVTSIKNPWAGAGTILPPGSRVEVDVSDLRLRMEPALSSDVERVLDKGDVLRVSGAMDALGPVMADGYAWYAVVWPTPDGPARRWVAQDSAGTYLSVLPARCDRIHEIQLEPFELLSCYGDNPVTIEGTGFCGCGATLGYWTPTWLAHPFAGAAIEVRPGSGFDGAILLRVPPTVDLTPPDEGQVVRVVGHFDDPAAGRCQMAFPVGSGGIFVPDPLAVVYYCREQFVLESSKVITGAN